VAYKLYDFNGNETSFDNLEDKSFWCKHGEHQELAFVKVFDELKSKNMINSNLDIQIHPEKENNPYHPDLQVNGSIVAEAKIKNSPLFMARTYGVDPQYALTIDLKDVFNYKKKLIEDQQDLLIFIWVKWEAHKMVTNRGETSVRAMAGIWSCNFSKILYFLSDNAHCYPKIHWYGEKFRQPQYYLEDEEWSEELLDLDSRLKEGRKVKNISSNGFCTPDKTGRTYPAGQSSASYVFDLSNENLFNKLYFKIW